MQLLMPRTKPAFLVASLFFLFAAGVPVRAQSPPSDNNLEQRVRELEAEVRRLREAQDNGRTIVPTRSMSDAEQPPAPNGTPEQLPPPTPKSTDGAAQNKEKSDKDSTPVAGWKDGFFLQSKEKDFVLRITGQIQTDDHAYLNDKDQTDIDSIFLRRARFGLEATMFQYYDFRFLPDFGQGQAVIQDAYLNIHWWEWLQFETGKFKQPFSYEQLIQDRFVPTMERSMIDQLTPARDVGFMVWGQKLFCDRLDYGFAVSNGEFNGNGDTNEHKDINGRIAARPFNSPEFFPWMHLLQVGISGGVGVEQEPVSPSTLKTPAFVPWFKYNSTVVADGVRSRWSPEIVYFYGPLGLAAQYLREEQELRPSAAGPSYPFRQDVTTQGFYVMGTYLLTGEERTGYIALDPIHPFNPCCPCACAGAWELVARVSRLEVDSSVFTPGRAQLANPATNSPGATETTFGFNWYLNRWVRMQWNWEHAWFDKDVQLGPTTANRTRYQDTIMTRFQVIF